MLRAADLELDLLRRRVTRGGQRIDLTAKEFALLELLLRRQGEVLPRSLIASQVWDMNFDSDTNVIEVAVRRLRAKVDDAFEPKLIRTVRGMGYVLEAVEPAPTMSRGPSLTARLAALFAALTATLLVLAALLLGRMLDAHFHELDVHELHGKLVLIRNTLRQADAHHAAGRAPGCGGGRARRPRQRGRARARHRRARAAC